MPYPGGKHAPGHYISDVALHPWQFIGAANTQQNPGNGAQDLNAPGGRQSGDLLVVGSFSSPDFPTPAGWTLEFGGNSEMYTRVADGTATDEFGIPARAALEDDGTLGIYAVLRPPAGVVTRVQLGGVEQHASSFNISDIALDANAFNVLIQVSNRSVIDPTQDPIFTSAPIPYNAATTPIYVSWAVAPTNRATYLGMAYILETTSPARAETFWIYSQFEGGNEGPAPTTSRGARFNVV